LQDSNDPLAFLSTLSTCELGLVAIKFGVPVDDWMIERLEGWYPEKLAKSRELRERMLEAQAGANDGAIEDDDPPKWGQTRSRTEVPAALAPSPRMKGYSRPGMVD
jgi:hypothetical protein